jgi:hypothetical protein
MASAWGNSWGIAWGDSWGEVAPIPVVADEQAHGGFLAPAADHKARVRRERERLGIIPKRVEKVIQRVALEQIPDDSARIEALIRAIEASNRTYKAIYAERLRQVMARLDEEEALLLLM